MFQLIINSAPASSPGASANANAINQNDPAGRSVDAPDSEAPAPFASLLKSQMDKNAASVDASTSASSTPAAAKTKEANVAASVDLAALLPLLGGGTAVAPLTSSSEPAATPVVLAGATSPPVTAAETAATAPDQRGLAGLLATALAPTVAGDAGPGKASNEGKDEPSAAAADPATTDMLLALPAMPLAAANTLVHKESASTRDEIFASAGAKKTEGARPVPGKIAPDTAIAADVRQPAGDSKASELPAGDFRAVMERAASMASGVSGATGNAPASPTLRVDAPMGQAGWHEEMGHKLTWMAGNNHQQADLVLTPPHLGRVEVSLTMNGDQATAVFTSSNPAVREALENSMYRLREVLADAGVNLGQTQVGSESPDQSSRQRDLASAMNDGVRVTSPIPSSGAQTVARTGAGRGMIDIFA